MTVYSTSTSLESDPALLTFDDYGGSVAVWPETSIYPAETTGTFPDTRRFIPSDVPADWYDSSAFDSLSAWERMRLGIFTDIYDIAPPPDPWARRDQPTADDVTIEPDKNFNVIISNNQRILRLFGHAHYSNDKDPFSVPPDHYLWSYYSTEGASEGLEGYSAYVEYKNELRVLTATWNAGDAPQYVVLDTLNGDPFILGSSSLGGTDILA